MATSITRKWDTDTVGQLPTGFTSDTGDATKISVQASGFDGDSPNCLVTGRDDAATHWLVSTATDGNGGDGTFRQTLELGGPSPLPFFLFRLDPTGGKGAYNAYQIQLYPLSSGGGGVFLDRVIGGSNNSGGGGNIGSVSPGGSGSFLPTGVGIAATIVAKGNVFSLQIQREDNSTYLTTTGTWSATQQNCITGTDASGSAILGAGKLGYLWYTATASNTVEFGDLTVNGIAVSAVLGATTVVAGSTASACTATGFTGSVVTWSSSNTSVATVNASTGVPTGVGAGTCDFIATGSANNTQTAQTGTFTVTSASVPTVTSASATLNQLATLQLSISGFTGGAATATSGNQGAATISGSVVTGVAHGQATDQTSTITIRGVADPTQVVSVVITVPAVRVTISPSTVSIGLNGTQQFSANVTGTTNTAVIWTETGAVSISNAGLFLGSNTAGSATATATSVADPGRSATATITVSALVSVTSIADFGQGYPGLAGTVGVTVSTLASGTLSLLHSRTTAGIVESGTGTGDYLAQVLAPPGATLVFAWDTGGSSPVTYTDVATVPIASGSALTVGQFNQAMATGFVLASSGLDNIQIEPGVNARQALSPILAAMAGTVSGAGTGVIVIKGGNTSTPRIMATTDNAGNRSSVTLSLPN